MKIPKTLKTRLNRTNAVRLGVIAIFLAWTLFMTVIPTPAPPGSGGGPGPQ